MKKMRSLLKKAFTSVTIMVIPHNSLKALNLRIPIVGLIVAILLAAVGGTFTLGMAVSGLKYKAQNNAMAEKVKFYSGQFSQWEATVAGLKAAESRFRRLFSLETKEEVLENFDAASVGSLGMHDQILDVIKSSERVTEITDYLRSQKNIYVSTPRGYPVKGDITSKYGRRVDPFSGEVSDHTGVDIACNSKTPIHATADGKVIYSGWMHNSGNVVILKHGHGFSTVYAHNTKNTVKVGQKVKRGDVVGYVGTTGKSTGPHVHYEVWKNNKTVNAEKYLSQKS